MPKRPEHPAKITRPNVAGIFRRERLLGLLDGVGEAVTWISAPAGSGKTTLLSNWLENRKAGAIWYRADCEDADPATVFHYLGLAAKAASPRKKISLPHLAPEYLPALPVFTRRFLEVFFASLKPGSAVVIDDFHVPAGNKVFIDIVAAMAESAPPGLRLFILSRAAPPAEYARLSFNAGLRLVSWAEMKFTLGETEGLLRYRGRDFKEAKRLHEATDGWAAGLLLMERLSYLTGEQDSVESRDKLFDYFMAEVIGKADDETVDFLLRSAFFPEFTESIAVGAAGRGNVRSLLSRLVKANFFIECYPGNPVKYRYHQMFREFLLAHARSNWTCGEISAAQGKAAEALEDAGLAEEAIDIYLDGANWNEAARLITAAAPLIMAQGRSKTIDRWIAALPGETLAAHGGLLRIRGICLLTVNLGEAKAVLEKAFRLLEAREDYAAAIQAMGCFLEDLIIEGSSYEAVDPCVDRLNSLVLDHAQTPVIAAAAEQVAGAVLFALAFRNLNHRSLPFWLETAEAAVAKPRDAAGTLKLCNYLMAYYMFTGEFTSMTRIMKVIGTLKKEAGDVQALRLLCLLLEAYHAVFAMADMAGGIAMSRKGIELGREMGVCIYEFWFSYLIISASVPTGDQCLAEETLATMMASAPILPPVRLGDLYILAGVTAMGRKACNEAVAFFRRSLEIIQQAGATYTVIQNQLLLAKALFELGDEAAARRYLALSYRDEWGHSEKFRYECLMVTAYFDLQKGQRKKCRAALREAFSAAKINGLLLSPFFDGKAFALVCGEALDAGIEVEFVRELARKHRLPPPPSGAATDAWPWPLKIYTLGRFEIARDDRPLRFDGKVQKKPIEMLKAIIAFGGRDILADRIMDALWPEADGDAAHTAMKATLHRLRQGLGGEGRILLKNGRLSLSEDHCWVDSLAFLSALSGADTGREAESRAEKALACYRGPFLPGDESQGWSVPMRERIRRLFIRLVGVAGGALSRAGRLAEAARLFEQAIEVDELDEDLYCLLMECFGRMGRRDKVVKTYNRCCAALWSHIQIGPSDATRKLYEELLAGKGGVKAP